MPDTSSSSASSESDIRDSPDWTEGDFALVSSDGWRYRVRGAALCWAR